MEYVTTESRLVDLATYLRGTELLAVDTEAAGYHRYLDSICLIQLSTREETFLIDPLALPGIAPLAPLLAAPGTEAVFHDADYDLRLLDRDFGVEVRGLFDTRIAAQFLGEPGIGLASLVEKYTGTSLAKRFQRADWAQRPLPREMLDYAAEDTRHLPSLRDALLAALSEQGRLGWAEEEFRLAERTRWAPNGDQEVFLRIKGTRDLGARQLAALRELHLWRESVAQERDVAPFRVVGNDILVEAARHMPATSRELSALPGIAPALARRYAEPLLSAIERSRALPESELPRRSRPPRTPPDPAFEARLERLRATRDRVAQALGLDRGFLMPRHQLERLARTVPESLAELEAAPDIRRWQLETLGDDLLRALRE